MRETPVTRKHIFLRPRLYIIPIQRGPASANLDTSHGHVTANKSLHWSASW